VASKTSELSTKELEELLDTVDLAMDRLKTLYESYFLGIQKQAPSFIHSDVERKLRDLQQQNMRNTGLRYRLATMQQKFGAYNSYWRRTLRQIENGTYIRNLAKIGREAARTGSEIPEEILAKMPKRMREQVVRDRDAAIAIAKRRNQVDDEQTGQGPAPDFPPDADEVAAMINEPSILRRELKTQAGAHVLADDDADMDFDSFFAAFNDDEAPKPAQPAASRPDPASTQAITRPLPKTPASGVPGMSLRTPAPPTTQPTTAIPRVAPNPQGVDPTAPTTALPKFPSDAPAPATTAGIPRVPGPGTGSVPRVPAPGQPTSAIPRVPAPGTTSSIPRVPGAMPRVPAPIQPPVTPSARAAPSQASRPNPIAPWSATQTGPTPVESMNGPFSRPDKPVTQTVPRATPPPRPGTPPPVRPAAPPMRPPPGMTEADVNALHAKYVKAKEAVGEKVDASSREKLLRTINHTAPKIMEQYKASGVDFSVVVKDNQVVIKAKPKG
jgi:hypothetical protein